MKIKNCFYFRRAAAALHQGIAQNTDTLIGNWQQFFPGLESQINAAFEEGRKTGNFIFHSNAAPEYLAGKLRGIDIYFSPKSEDSERLATIIANNLKSIYPLPEKSNAVPTSSLGEVLQTKAVAVLCELGYHDNYADEAWLKNNLNEIAKNLVQSLCDYFGIPFVYPTAIKWGTVTTDGSNLNIRNYPSLSGSIIGSIPNGAAVMISGETNGWYVVNYNGITGYSDSRFITI